MADKPETVLTGIEPQEAVMTAFSLALREKVISEELTQDQAVAIYRQGCDFATHLLLGDILEVHGRDPVKIKSRSELDQIDTGDKPDNLIIGG